VKNNNEVDNTDVYLINTSLSSFTLGVDFSDSTSVWDRIRHVVQIPWFVVCYIVRGKATIR